MPAAEHFPHAEERRLLYVALTRARRQVILLAPKNRMSSFVIELIRAARVVVNDAVGTEASGAEVPICAKCGQGSMVQRKNHKTGKPFLGCSRFPACTHTLP